MDYTLHSSGLVWDEERLAGRYAFLRRRRDEVKLELLYYPYWLFHMQGTATWRFFGQKTLEMLVVVDACTGRSQRVSSVPECCEEGIRVDTDQEQDGFSPAVLKLEGDERTLSACVISPECNEEQAARSGEEFALSLWRRRCNLPLGPRADIRCMKSEPFFLYKPFWVMRPKEKPESGQTKMFVFDASTGLGGVSEFWNVVERVLQMQGREEGETL